MDWNKVNLRAKEKNLPQVNIPVLWATNQDSPNDKIFHKFVGWLTKDGKYIDTGLGRHKLTSKFWWCEMTDPVE